MRMLPTISFANAIRALPTYIIIERDYDALKFQGPKMHCEPCAHRARCLRHPDRTPARQVVFFKDRGKSVKQSYTTKMQQKIDTPEGRQQYSRRLGIVEPVFGHITSCLGLKRFSLRGGIKVNIQWKLFCIVHHLTKYTDTDTVDKMAREAPTKAPLGPTRK